MIEPGADADVTTTKTTSSTSRATPRRCSASAPRSASLADDDVQPRQGRRERPPEGDVDPGEVGARSGRSRRSGGPHPGRRRRGPPRAATGGRQLGGEPAQDGRRPRRGSVRGRRGDPAPPRRSPSSPIRATVTCSTADLGGEHVQAVAADAGRPATRADRRRSACRRAAPRRRRRGSVSSATRAAIVLRLRPIRAVSSARLSGPVTRRWSSRTARDRRRWPSTGRATGARPADPASSEAAGAMCR